MSGRAGVAWVASPIALAALGLATGTAALVGLQAAGYEGRRWPLTLLSAGAGAAALAWPATRGLLRLERRDRAGVGDHLRQSAVVYALLAYTAPTWGGGDGAIMYVFPAAALAGVAVANAAALRGWRPPRPAA